MKFNNVLAFFLRWRLAKQAPSASIRPRIAILIDAENLAPVAAERAICAMSSFGQIKLLRAYGNFEVESPAWQSLMHRTGLRAIQQSKLAKGKNGSDIALAVDAMSLLQHDQYDAFAIVSNDSDFTPLVRRIRENGYRVFGFGTSKCSRSLRQACEEFFVTDVETGGSEAVLPSCTSAIAATRLVVRSLADSTGWAPLSKVACELYKRYPDFKRESRAKRISVFLRESEQFDVILVGGGVHLVAEKRTLDLPLDAHDATPEQAPINRVN